MALLHLLQARSREMVAKIVTATGWLLHRYPPEQIIDAAVQASIDIHIDYTITNRRLIRYLAQRPHHLRAFDNVSGLNATLLAMTTRHMTHYRSESSPNALA